MQLTNEMVQRFVGGQIGTISSWDDGDVCRGQIATIVIQNGVLKVGLVWFAKDDGVNPVNRRWVKVDKFEYNVNLFACSSIQNIGPGLKGSDQFCLVSNIEEVVITLYPPDGDLLDRSRVEGL